MLFMAKKNPLSPLDLAPLPATQNFSGDAEERVKQIKKLHERIREKIAKQNEKYQAQANKHRLFAEFKEGDLVWVHLRKESLELMDHSKFSNALVKMPKRLNYQLSMRFQTLSMFLIFHIIMVKKALTTRGRVFFNLTGRTRNKGSSIGCCYSFLGKSL